MAVDALNAELLQRIDDLAARLPAALLHALAVRVEELPQGATPKQAGLAAAALPNGLGRAQAAALLVAWRKQVPAWPPVAVALALRAAGQTEARHRQRTVEVVWTGPYPENSTLRRTEQALLDVIASAKQELLVVTFAAYPLKPMLAALRAAADRGVALRFVFESSEVSEGKVSTKAEDALDADLLRRSKLYVWPVEKRAKDSQGRWGSLHAKCAVADRRLAFVSSANLTGYAMTINMELGLLIADEPSARRIAEHVDALVAEKVLVRLKDDAQPAASTAGASPGA